jgi:hypothetical protein
MIRILFIVLVNGVLSAACSRDDSYTSTPQIATWEFMQSVGGIRIGKAERQDRGWVFPVVCDVSGLKAVTRQPTAMHSGVVVTRVLHSVNGRDIGISVVVNTPVGSTTRRSACPSITLNGTTPGDYRIQYMESNKATHALGTITLE